MTRWQKLLVIFKTSFFSLLIFSCPIFSQNNETEEIEVYLEFRHRGVINTVIVSYYQDDVFYLPVNELFSTFQIDAQTTGLVVSGKFSEKETPYEINLSKNIITFGNTSYPITADDVIIKELDFYLKSDLYNTVFGLSFFIDFNNLGLSLETKKKIPIVERAFRAQRRRIADGNRYTEERYDLEFDRVTPFFDLGFVDYNLSSTSRSNGTIYNYNANIGSQLAGGDLQGALFGNVAEGNTTFLTDNFRWRYVVMDSPIISKITLGQTQTNGLLKTNYTGIKITNEPIEPRRMFDEFIIMGSTFPESEVELYLNNLLIDYKLADDAGNYRFLAPISYGSSQINLKIYGPTGQIIERSNQIQIPFTFQPKGVLDYNINVGQLDNPIIGSSNRDFTYQANGAYGLTNWLTGKVGVEYFESYHTSLPTLFTSVSSRIRDKYIVTLEGATEAYYRSTLSATFPNFMSFNIDYTDFISGFSIYNGSNDQKRIITNLFYPFELFKLPLSVRLASFSRIRETINSTTFRVDVKAIINKLNIRLAYSDRQDGDFDPLNPTTTSALETSVTYNIANNRNLPFFIRGVFLRTQFRYLPVVNNFESAEFLISQNILKKGRFQVAVGRNYLRDFNTIRFSLILDFNKVRSSTTFSNIQDESILTQNFRGSIGYDSNYGNLLFTSRNQVGRSASAIKLFVDNNGNGSFDKDIDDSIEENAVRLNRSGATSTYKNGILYFTQMQPYFYYNMEMNKGAIKNPMLVPQLDRFGLISDPNRFKKIEVPFYLSGVIEGTIERWFAEGRTAGIAGLKLLLTRTDGNFYQELRTFSDGSFYSYEVPPGEYELKVDQSQLDLLDVKSSPGSLSFTVQALSEGDFVEGLNMVLYPKGTEIPTTSPIDVETIIANIENSSEISDFETELEKQVEEVLRLIILAQNAFYKREIQQALTLVNQSLDIFETAQGYALKGSLQYLLGQKAEAQSSWDKAILFDPNIFIPNMDTLDRIITPDVGNP